jgi:flagellar motility protein MotE (MotC chaperone)
MLQKIRLLPVLILTAVLVLGVKIEAVIEDAGRIDFSRAMAQSEGAAETDTIAKVETGSKPGAASTESKAAAKTDEKTSNGSDAAAPTADAQVTDVSGFTQAELEVLQSLAKRRETLDKQASQIELREGVLKATERRIEEKITRLKQLEAQIEELLKRNDREEEEQIKSLVKVYEAMKPKEAARIFEQLDFEILVSVTVKMREVKMAAILAKMDTARAKELTVKLATRRQLPKVGG